MEAGFGFKLFLYFSDLGLAKVSWGSSKLFSTLSQSNEDSYGGHHRQKLLPQLCLLEEIAEGRLTIILFPEAALFWFESGMLLVIGSVQTRLSHPSVFSASFPG